MTVTDIFWPDTGGRDIHLLPGLVSPRLDHLLWIEDSDGNERADRHSGVTLSFVPRFAGQPSNHGVTVDTATGEVTVSSSLPAGARLRSFIIDVVVTAGVSTFFSRVRVHVHERIKPMSMWLTPTPLTVREGSRNMRFTVLAQFDDDSIGDISNWSPFDPPEDGDRTFVHARGSDLPELVWSSNSPGAMDVDADTGELACADADADARITAQRRPLPPVDSATATALGAAPWSTPVALTQIAGPGFAAMRRPDIRNVLVLPDGFRDTSTERAAFRRLARDLVTQLSTRGRTRPFDVLKGKFNWFRAFVPSPQAGITVLTELDRVNKSATAAEGLALDLPQPPSGPSAWTLGELIHEVGLPTPRHDPDNSPLGDETTGRLRDWRTLYGTKVTAARVTTKYPSWLLRNDRVLLNERDTAFHIEMGARPQIHRARRRYDLGRNVLRLHQADLDTFLNALEDPDGNPVGDVWAEGGKDEALVLILCRTNREGGTNSGRGTGRLLCVSVGGDDRLNLQPNPDGNGFDLRVDPIPGAVLPDLWTLVAHEMAHSFTLEDEYGGGGAIPPSRGEGLADDANAQPRSELLTGGSLDGDKIKWRWPRIEQAGTLAAPIELLGDAGRFRLRLERGHARLFKVGDVVRLRTRPLLTAGPTSVRLQVTSVDRTAGALVVDLRWGGAITPGAYPPGTVVLVPRRAPDPSFPDVLGADLELVHESVRTRITATHNPLDADWEDPPDRECEVEGPTPTPATNFQDGVAPNPPRYSSWIVGLYENANEFNCGVYRPTGVCIMRQRTYDDQEAKRERAYQFCPVCRYAMVDMVDPSKHGAIDRDYEPRYPK